LSTMVPPGRFSLREQFGPALLVNSVSLSSATLFLPSSYVCVVPLTLPSNGMFLKSALGMNRVLIHRDTFLCGCSGLPQTSRDLGRLWYQRHILVDGSGSGFLISE
jgi:hypothetical protein